MSFHLGWVLLELPLGFAGSPRWRTFSTDDAAAWLPVLATGAISLRWTTSPGHRGVVLGRRIRPRVLRTAGVLGDRAPRDVGPRTVRSLVLWVLGVLGGLVRAARARVRRAHELLKQSGGGLRPIAPRTRYRHAPRTRRPTGAVHYQKRITETRVMRSEPIPLLPHALLEVPGVAGRGGFRDATWPGGPGCYARPP